ncbi:hypothetical protein CPB84DRAFT_1801085 [Gymnopilus junonius]|uniref:Uncharacterized protein n=1 Tax=Gymnopilus junonius TaxID=109634 RepID=A0A9P5NA38_GYMJU|nr:hypothetical protein CPB84DRAFT_1801085 [Gymnopilus junonius]
MFGDNPTVARTPFASLQQADMGWNAKWHEADLQWADHVTTQYPYYPEEKRLKLAANDARSIPSMVAQDVKQSIENTNSQLTKILQHITASPSHPTFLSTQHLEVVAASPPCGSSLGPYQPALMPVPFPVLPPSLQPQDQSGMLVTRSLTLGNGRQLILAADDVPALPAVLFAHDIPTLNRMWDDMSKHWVNDSKLHIKGVAIVIVYWKDIYTSKSNINWKLRQWKGIKGNWFNWKVIVQRYREGMPDQFWAAFSEKGQHLGYKAILEWLSLERKEKNHQLAEKIKAEYGGQFSQVFSYKKNGKIHVKSRDCDIIKQYYKEKGIVGGDEAEEIDSGEVGDE